MEWYSRCARDAFEQISAGGSSTTVHLTRPGGCIYPEPIPVNGNSLKQPKSEPNVSLDDSKFTTFSIVTIASHCASDLFRSQPQSQPQDADITQQTRTVKVPTGIVFVERGPTNNFYQNSQNDENTIGNRIKRQIREKSSEYKDLGYALAAEYKYQFEEYLEEKKIELSKNIKAEAKIAQDVVYAWTQELINEVKLRAFEAKEKVVVLGDEYASQAKIYAAKKGEELSVKLQDELKYREEIAKVWAEEFAILAKEKSIEVKNRGFILAEEYGDKVSTFVVEKGGELVHKVHVEAKNTATYVQQWANELTRDAKIQAGGKLLFTEQKSADKRTLEKAEQLQAELTRSAEIARKWAEELAIEAKRLEERIKKENFVAKAEQEYKETVTRLREAANQTSAVVSEQEKRQAEEVEKLAKEVYDKFQKELQDSAEKTQKLTAELAAEATKQADLAEERGKDLLEKLRQELEGSAERAREFREATKKIVNVAEENIKKGTRELYKEHKPCQSNTEDLDAAQKNLQNAEKRAVALTEQAIQAATALAVLTVESSDEAEKKRAELKVTAAEIEVELKSAQETVQKIYN